MSGIGDPQLPRELGGDGLRRPGPAHDEQAADGRLAEMPPGLPARERVGLGLVPAELLLEPSDHPAVKPYRDALVEDGIPLAQFAVDDLAAEHERLTGLGVVFTQPPTDIGTALVAVFDDTCGNLIQLLQMKAA